MRAGTVQATMRAFVGTLLVAETFESQRWPGIMPSRANENSRRLAAACRLSTQDRNAVIATTRKSFAPTGPSVDSRIAGIGSASSPETIAWRSGAAST